MTDASRVNAYERQAHESRRRLASTLDELADNLTPGRVLDEVMSYARGGGGSFLKSLGNAATANPIPVALLGISATMFLTGRGRLSSGPEESRRASVLQHAADRMSAPGQSKPSIVNDAGTAASQAVRTAGSAIGDGAAAVGAAASGAVDAVGSAASSVAQQASAGVAAVGSVASEAREGVAAVTGKLVDAGQKASGAVARATHSAGEAVGEVAEVARKTVADTGAQVLERGSRISAEISAWTKKLVQEQPLLVAAAGLAIGGAIAAALPRTKAEDSLMGDTSDAMKGAVVQMASEQFEVAKSVADTVVEEAKQTAMEVGLSPTAAVSAVRDLGDKLKEAISPAKLQTE